MQWVLTAYAITFGGFLLLGGRLADYLGRRRIFVVGVSLFTLASLVCGLAGSADVLIGSRALQGVGAAIVSPAALSIVSTIFDEGAERNKALGIWGALGGSGAAVGVLLGGILTKYLGWEWIFFVNVPVGARGARAHVSASFRRAASSREPPVRRRRRGDSHQSPRHARLRDHEGARRRLGLDTHDRLLIVVSVATRRVRVIETGTSARSSRSGSSAMRTVPGPTSSGSCSVRSCSRTSLC